jgi:hypothetical protein
MLHTPGDVDQDWLTGAEFELMLNLMGVRAEEEMAGNSRRV